MNTWLIWSGLVLAAVALLALTDGIVQLERQRLIGWLALPLLLTSAALTVWLPVLYWQAILLSVGQLFLILICLRLLFSRRVRSTHSTAQDTGQMVVILAASVLLSFLPPIVLMWLLLMAILSVSLVMLLQLKDGAEKYLIDEVSDNIADLPTVSVCIPARNETHALADCLNSVLESDYPKLEIIVLDDCSQDKTSRVIHSFAHAGVRFVQGENPSSDWLGKNHALQVLSKEATGQYLFFIGVDTRLSKKTISQLVSYMQNKKTSMISVLPKKDGYLALDSVLSTLRYFWQLTTPRSIDMPVATSLWMIRASELEKMGGIKQAANLIEPERYFARILSKKHNFHFLISNSTIGAFYAKKWSSQIETSVRLWYPLLDMRPARVYLAAIGQYLFVYLPFVIAVSFTMTNQNPKAVFLSLIIILMQYVIFGFHIFRTQTRARVLATLLYPLVALQEVALILTSFVQFEFGTVNWKGRNICYPILAPLPWRD